MDELFAQPPLLSWLPGETLFSLVSRHHLFRANPTSAATCEQFFGHPRAGTQHDLPSCLSEFATRTSGRFGTADDIACRHTLLAYYSGFASDDEIRYLVGQMAGHSVAHLKLRLGILTSRFRAHHPLKACPACVVDDRAMFGWSYWHLEHQFPGVWVCRRHNQLLQESNLKANGVRRFLWHLPSEMAWSRSGECADIPPATLNSLRALTDTVLQLVNLATDKKVNLQSAHEIYRMELAQRGWMTSGGSLRMPQIVASFLEHVRPLRTIAELQTLPQTPQEARGQLGRILRPPRSGTHPLRHAVMCQWLFGGVRPLAEPEFEIANSRTASGFVVLSGPLGRKRKSDSGLRQQLAGLLTNRGMSLRQVSAMLDIDVATAIAWATAAGIRVNRRPQKLAGFIRQAAINALAQGADKAAVARDTGVSIGTITRLLFGEIGLHEKWQSARHTAVQQRMRQIWQETESTYSGLGIKYFRSLCPAAYAWLYRNDREWLNAHKPASGRTANLSGKPRVQWDERDRNLSVAVEKTAHRLVSENGRKKLMLWQLCQALPELRTKLNALDRLPLTRHAIDQALHRNLASPGLCGDLLTHQ